MRDPFEIRDKVLGSAVEVHRQLGPGLPEMAYEKALAARFGGAGLDFRRPVWVPSPAGGRSPGAYRLNFVIQETLPLDVASVDRLHPAREEHVVRCLRALRKTSGLLINFNVPRLEDGIRSYWL
jgi:GxxExxY protein